MASHRTWGVFFTRKDTVYIQMSEVAFLDAGGSDLSVGGQPGASSEYSSDYLAAFAFDKNSSTDWNSAYEDLLFRALWYVHPSAVEVAKLRVTCSNTPYIPQSPLDMQVRWSDDFGATWSPEVRGLALESGSLASGATAVLTLTDGPALAPIPGMQKLEQNMLQPNSRSNGVISDRVVVKTAPSGAEVPFAGGRVWLLRAVDGYKAWEGWSDVDGYYTATGLELGVAYIAVGIDPYGGHKATGAGPVVATAAP